MENIARIILSTAFTAFFNQTENMDQMHSQEQEFEQFGTEKRRSGLQKKCSRKYRFVRTNSISSQSSKKESCFDCKKFNREDSDEKRDCEPCQNICERQYKFEDERFEEFAKRERFESQYMPVQYGFTTGRISEFV